MALLVAFKQQQVRTIIVKGSPETYLKMKENVLLG